MFGYKLVKEEEYNRLTKCSNQIDRLYRVHRWFSGWKDLDIIWDYIIKCNKTVDDARNEYAKARNTTVYGDTKLDEALKTLSQIRELGTYKAKDTHNKQAQLADFILGKING